MKGFLISLTSQISAAVIIEISKIEELEIIAALQIERCFVDSVGCQLREIDVRKRRNRMDSLARGNSTDRRNTSSYQVKQ